MQKMDIHKEGVKALKTTERGIRYISFIEEKPEIDIPAMVKKAKTPYKPFNFKDKIELLVFYEERKDFSHAIFTEYGIIDNEFDGQKVIHHPFGVKSIIGIELSGDDTIPLISYILGQAIEHFKQNLDIERHAAWRNLEKNEAYRCWQSFFCQVHSASLRYELEGAADLFLKSLPFVLARKADSLSAPFIDGTFRHLVHSMAELYVLMQAEESEAVEDHLVVVSELMGANFLDIYRGMYAELVHYLKETGTKYNEVHEFSLFKKIEERKSQMASFQNE